MGSLPVRMVWKAVSTLVESRADVSRNDRPFFSENQITQFKSFKLLKHTGQTFSHHNTTHTQKHIFTLTSIIMYNTYVDISS